MRHDATTALHDVNGRRRSRHSAAQVSQVYSWDLSTNCGDESGSVGSARHLTVGTLIRVVEAKPTTGDLALDEGVEAAPSVFADME